MFDKFTNSGIFKTFVWFSKFLIYCQLMLTNNFTVALQHETLGCVFLKVNNCSKACKKCEVLNAPQTGRLEINSLITIISLQLGCEQKPTICGCDLHCNFEDLNQFVSIYYAAIFSCHLNEPNCNHSHLMMCFNTEASDKKGRVKGLELFQANISMND